MNRDSRFLTLILLEAVVIPMILETKKRSTNTRADDAVLFVQWMNRKSMRRPWGNRKSHTLQNYRIAAELGISESRVKNAKKLLSSLHIIDFGGTIYNKSTKFFVKLWNISVRYSRYAFVWNPTGEVISESRPGEKVNSDHLRFKLVSKSHAKFAEADLDSDTIYDNKHPWLHEMQEKAEFNRLAGVKKIAKTALHKMKKLSSDIFYSNLDFGDVEFSF